MRHQDANLTAKLYTHDSQPPTFEAGAKLDWEGAGRSLFPSYLPSQNPVPAGHGVARMGLCQRRSENRVILPV